MGKTHNLWITVGCCGKLSLPCNSFLPELCWRHSKLCLDPLEGKIGELLIKLFQALGVGFEAVELPELDLQPAEERLL